MTLTYVTEQPFETNSWIYMEVPKANYLYSTDSTNVGYEKSLVESSIASSSKISFTIGGSTKVV